MINFFTPASADASLEYLSMIFGNMNGVIPGTGSTITILGTMFRTFNATLLTVGALIIVYITVVGVMMTAHEGEFMKKWNSLWTPIRAVFGIAALVPTGSGFSGIQILMMWVIVQGVGAADMLWNTVLGYVNYAGSPFAQISLSNVGVAVNIANLYKVIVCEQSARASYAPPYRTIPQTGAYYCNVANAWCSSSDNIDLSRTNVNTFDFGPNGSCGTLVYCNQTTQCADATSLACLSCRAQVSALQALITTLRGAADLLVRADYEYQNYYMNGYITVDRINPNVSMPDWLNTYCSEQSIPSRLCRGPAPASADSNAVMVPGGLPDPSAGGASASDEVVKHVYWPYAIKPVVGNENFINTGVSYYMNAMESEVGNYIATQAVNNPELGAQYQSARRTGWIFAGAYYYTITAENSSNIQNTLPRLMVNMTDPQTGTTDNPNTLKDYRSNFSAARELIQSMQGGATGPGGETVAVLADGGDALNMMMQQATDPGTTNPIIQLAAVGYALLMAAQFLFIAFLGISFVLGIISGVNAFVLGTGGFNPMAVATPVIMMIVVPLLGALLGLMVSVGATLGVYVPLIPYVIFTFGAIGWLTSTIETMVAGPLVAVGILAPGGHHEILGKAEPALMLLFNVFLRPSLMIFGLIASMLLASVVVTMINKMFFTVVFQIIGAGTSSLDTSSSGVSASNTAAGGAAILQMIIFLVAYVGLIVSALNKCFSAIHIIPEKVMRWISGQGEQYGEGEAVGEMKRGVEGAASTAGAGMKGAGKAAESAGESVGKKQAGQEHEEKKANEQKIEKE